jgi:hypothetical protein
MGRSSYRPDEDHYRDHRCVCLHLTTWHQDAGNGACEVCRCGQYVPAIDPQTGEVKAAS